MDHSYERFVGGPTPHPSKSFRVTINRGNVITFNRNCFRRMGAPEAVVLYFNRALNTIVLQPSSPRLNDAFPINEQTPGEKRINAAPFCRHFGISIDSSLRFIDPNFTENGLELNLSRVVSVAKRRKRK